MTGDESPGGAPYMDCPVIVEGCPDHRRCFTNGGCRRVIGGRYQEIGRTGIHAARAELQAARQAKESTR